MKKSVDSSTSRTGSTSFIIRIWWERVGWKGWVQHTRTGDEAIFDQPAELWEFIQQRTGLLETPEKTGLK